MESVLIGSYVLLWILTVLVAVLLLATIRQVGIILTRLGPVGARMMDPGPVIGQEVDNWRGTDIRGKSVEIGYNSKRTLLLFVSTSCTNCKSLMPIVRTWSKTERNLEVIVISIMDDREKLESYVFEHKLHEVPVVIAPELAMKYGVGLVPYAVLIGSDGAVKSKGLANHGSHLESLLNAEETGFASLDEWNEIVHQSDVLTSGKSDAASVVVASDGHERERGRE